MFINFKPVEESKKITNTKELAEYILDKSSGIESMTEVRRMLIRRKMKKLGMFFLMQKKMMTKPNLT